MRILALDQGTTSTRLLQADPDLRVLGQRRHQTFYPGPERVEMDGAEILSHCRQLLTLAGPADALGLANQGESCLAWDRVTKAPLSPVISWQDRRTLGDLARLEPLAEEVRALSGLPLDPYFSAAKLGQLARAHPGARLGTTDAFLLDNLTGHFATDRATASRTGLMNLDRGEWDARLCQIFGVPLGALPEIRPTLAGFGTAQGAPVTAAITDQQAALYGHGCRNPGEAKITFGTGAFALALTKGRPHPKGILPTVAWDLGGITYALDGGVQDAGSAVDWALRAGIAQSLDDFAGFDTPAIARGLAFLPAFSGLGAPHWDRTAAPLIIGMGPDTTRRDLCQALLEGLAFQTAALVAEIAEHVPLMGLFIDGGISSNSYFAGFLATVTQRPVTLAGTQECTAFGAASLAARALGVTLTPPPPGPTHQPGPPAPEWAARFDAALTRARGWRDLSL
ncbi:FGGY-family carbohydrate kinase [Rhodobacter sp. KR11]|jgi:glycerol kinase|uniref:FGGY family carbohydrate kinase n=1 Tax=Rhodobacter sp. KR11 TaxID=2974588 RepID=UPI002221302E|nr:FGGY family carbohydrate kinase [Rhodobacter sp. KR11]MCW1918141.1 FGGY-family carbohydrate kinase [Rhodobacter sp. KR11]